MGAPTRLRQRLSATSPFLAQYSALMWIEKKKGPKAVDDILEDYRIDLLKTNSDNKTMDSAGPLTCVFGQPR